MGFFIQPQPHAAIPWSPQFAQQFRERRGYELAPLLPALFAEAGPRTQRVRCDFWSLVGELVSTAYFQQIQTWCHQHKMASTGHLLWEEQLAAHVPYYGDFFACARFLDIPGIDCLTSYPPSVQWHIAKMIGSIAHLYGHEKTMSETSDFSQRYRAADDKRPVDPVPPEWIRGTNNLLYLAGINTTTSYYGWQDLDTPQQRAMNDYIGRLGVMLTGGRHVCDLGMLYPIHTLWAHHIPATGGATASPEATAVDEAFRDLSRRLFAAQRDFDYLDAGSVDRAETRDGALRIANTDYRVLLLPRVEVLPQKTAEKMAELFRHGGTVIAVGTIPRASTQDFPSEAVTRLATEVFGQEAATDPARVDALSVHHGSGGGTGIYLPPSSEVLLPNVLDAVLGPDFRSSASKSPLRYTHQQHEGRQVYFVINDSPEPAKERLTVCAGGAAELWRPLTGERSPWSVVPDSGGFSAGEVSFAPYEGLFLLLAEGKPRPRRAGPAELRAHTEITSLEQIAGRTVAPVARGPEHVTSTVGLDQAVRHNGRASQRIAATLAKTDTNSWCFPSFEYDKPLDLSPYQQLRFWSYVPPGQTSTNARLLVMLHEASGADYLLEAGRALNAPGWQQSRLWLTDFNLAGWTKDANGKLDLNQIAAVRIGWGGYFGQAGEQIVFHLGEVELAKVEVGK